MAFYVTKEFVISLILVYHSFIMIIIFTGDGKGKTSAAITTVLRSLAADKAVSLIQFLKTGFSGEIEVLNKLKSHTYKNISIQSFGSRKLVDPKNLQKDDFDLFNEALIATNHSIATKPFLLVLDEILVALKFKLINEEDLIKIISTCKEKNIHLILTGRGATKKITAEADLVTEMKKIKHPFDQGKKAIKGIDL